MLMPIAMVVVIGPKKQAFLLAHVILNHIPLYSKYNVVMCSDGVA